jgi:hypothetical protein
MEFGEYKKQLIEISKTIDACKEGYSDLLKAESWYDLCLIVRDSFEWCVEHKLITPELIKEHWLDCKRANIFCNENVNNGFVIVTSNSEITAYGHSYVIAMDNAKVTAYNSSLVVAHGNAEVLVFDDCTVHAYDDASVEAYDYSRVHSHGNNKVSHTENCGYFKHDEQ